jgi:hypothetical protein
VRAALRLLDVLAVRPDDVGDDEIDAARSAGLTEEMIRDVGMVCTMFSIITRLADTLEFAMPESFEGSVKALMGRGYVLPAPVLRLPRV